MKLNLGAGLRTLEGFVNVDKFLNPGTDKQLDLFRFPWDFPDNSCEEFYLGHIVEHIPHEIKKAAFPNPVAFTTKDGLTYEWWENRWKELENLDGWFAFFAEVWRIGKPDAVVKIVAPFGYSHSAFQDPTHTRYLVPQSFAYLTQEIKENKCFDYHLPLLFETVDFNLEIPMDWHGIPPEGQVWAISHMWDIAQNMIATLRVVK